MLRAQFRIGLPPRLRLLPFGPWQNRNAKWIVNCIGGSRS
jgi:hypothetical protein